MIIILGDYYRENWFFPIILLFGDIFCFFLVVQVLKKHLNIFSNSKILIWNFCFLSFDNKVKMFVCLLFPVFKPTNQDSISRISFFRKCSYLIIKLFCLFCLLGNPIYCLNLMLKDEIIQTPSIHPSIWWQHQMMMM